MLIALFAVLLLAMMASFSSQVTGNKPQGGAKNDLDRIVNCSKQCEGFDALMDELTSKRTGHGVIFSWHEVSWGKVLEVFRPHQDLSEIVSPCGDTIYASTGGAMCSRSWEVWNETLVSTHPSAWDGCHWTGLAEKNLRWICFTSSSGTDLVACRETSYENSAWAILVFHHKNSDGQLTDSTGRVKTSQYLESAEKILG